MKSFAFALLAVGTAQAFVPARFGSRCRTALGVKEAKKTERTDATRWIQAALDAAETYGPSSPEARLAWEAVEEIDASDNSASYTTGVSDEECFVEQPSQECIDYSNKLDEMRSILKDYGPKLNKVRELAMEVQALKMPEAPKKPGTDSPALQQALRKAKEVTEKSGISSSEAKLAWAEVEEVASASNSNALGGMLELDEECLVETIDACDALEELNRALHVKDSPDRYQG